MKRLTTIATACVLAALAALASQVGPQETNASERTFMAFSAPSSSRRITLEAGTYEFRLADTEPETSCRCCGKTVGSRSDSGRSCRPNRPQVSGETVVMFKETKEGTTPAVQFWYFPNEKIGKEFIYPKEQAQKIAQRTGETVRLDRGSGQCNGVCGEQRECRGTACCGRTVGRGRQCAAWCSRARKPHRAVLGAVIGTRNESVEPEPAPRATAQVEPAPRPVGTSGSGASAEAPQASELPRTASPLPLSGLIGLLSLAGAVGLRAMRR